MKKRLFLVLIASLLLLCACQPTPETEFVVNKADQQQMIEKAQEDAVYASPEAETAHTADDPEKQSIDWAARLGAPERYTTTLKSVGGHLTVDVDAKVILPDTELPIAHVSPRCFSDDDAKQIIRALFGENPKCIPPHSDNMSKAMYDRQIARWKDDLDHWEEYGNVIWDRYDTKADFEKALQELILKASNAPEMLDTFAPTYEWEPLVWETASGKKTYGDRVMDTIVLREDGTRSRLHIYDGAAVMRSSIIYSRDLDEGLDYWDDDAAKWPNEMTITEGEARTIAETTLKEMGFDHLVCAFSKTTRSYRSGITREGLPYRPCWAFVFTPAVNGAALTYTYRTNVESTEYNRYWNYERCYILVDEQGIAALEYYDICKPDEVTVEVATLLPFDQIIEIFEKMVLIVENYADALNRDQMYSITSVRLGMVSIPEQNGEGGYMVPCWDFMGDPFPLSEFPEFWQDMGWSLDGSHSFLTINAIDGSIIRREQ